MWTFFKCGVEPEMATQSVHDHLGYTCVFFHMFSIPPTRFTPTWHYCRLTADAGLSSITPDNDELGTTLHRSVQKSDQKADANRGQNGKVSRNTD